MSNRTLQIDDGLYDYLTAVSLRESQVLRDLREETSKLDTAAMQIAPEQGQFMAFLVKSLGAERCLEVGSYTGYSALVCANALPPHGRLIALDISKEWTDIARRYWRMAGVEKKIELRLGPADESLREMLKSGEQGRIDFMFIDADKPGYRTYFELGLDLLRPGGVIAFDNVLWGGRVADPDASDADTVAIRQLNEYLHGLTDLDLSLVPIGDGLTLVRKPG
jgi:predicted O-methyltransferase YrrM